MKTATDMLDRMEVLVRRMAGRQYAPPSEVISGHDYAEARAIVAELPEPVDLDLIEAREIAAAPYRHTLPAYSASIIAGSDRQEDAELVLAGIKRGRELERAS